MSEGRIPHEDQPILRVVFLIAARPPPNLLVPEKWSDSFRDFVSKCLTKDAQARASIAELLQHPFITEERDPSALQNLIDEARARAVCLGGPEILMGYRDICFDSATLVKLCCAVVCRHYAIDQLADSLPTELIALCTSYNSKRSLVLKYEQNSSGCYSS
eukprot:TRINITY_DN1221_c0_g1_i9.p1 TRINITY_DN1221_c0_g1~~TRINITY_DN1221_c0_g1_i9.p1  ORF type:complete len:160 (+),score=22.90 TRINITY_DN1221_c0_g1_i9:419-898(+)